MPKRKNLAANKQLLAEAKQTSEFYLGLSDAGREFLMSVMASMKTIPAYHKTPAEIAVPQPRVAEARPNVEPVEGVRQVSWEASVERAMRQSLQRQAAALRRAKAMKSLQKKWIWDATKQVDATLEAGGKFYFVEMKTAAG